MIESFDFQKKRKINQSEAEDYKEYESSVKLEKNSIYKVLIPKWLHTVVSNSWLSDPSESASEWCRRSFPLTFFLISIHDAPADPCVAWYRYGTLNYQKRSPKPSDPRNGRAQTCRSSTRLSGRFFRGL